LLRLLTLPTPQPPAERHRQQDAGDVAEALHHHLIRDPLAGLGVIEAHRAGRNVAVADRLDVVVQVEAQRSPLVGALVEDALVGLAGVLAVVLQVRGRRQAVDGPHVVDALPRHPVARLLLRQLLLRLALRQLGQLGGVGRLRPQLQQGHGGALLASGVGLAQEGAQAAERFIRRLGEALGLRLGVKAHPLRREALGPGGDGARGALDLPGDGGPGEAARAQLRGRGNEGTQVLRHGADSRKVIGGRGREMEASHSVTRGRTRMKDRVENGFVK
jgi:hypothetical protein